MTNDSRGRGEHPEPDERPMAWTYVRVIAIEVLVLIGLWWLQASFG